jgi:glycogen synthase
MTPLRIYYMAGPGDVLTSFEHWRRRQDDPNITAVAYSSQFFDACRELCADLWAVSTHPRVGSASEGRITVEHRSSGLEGKSGASYHLAHLRYAANVVRDVRRFRANVLFLFGNDLYPFLIEPLHALGVHIVTGMHCVLWAKHAKISRVRRAVLRLSAPYYRRHCSALLSISADINAQVEQLTGGRHCPIVDFRPYFRAQLFQDIEAPVLDARPFRVLFAGRVETDKGVFDLLEVAQRLRDRDRSDIEFDLCGDGSALAALRERAIGLGLAASFRLHGWCGQDRTRELLGRSHVVVVPTRSDFGEGFNKVVVEAILAGRPAVTSSVCPSAQYARDAIIEVAPDQSDAYLDAICALADDRSLYRRLQAATVDLRPQFLDSQYSYGAAVRHVLGALQNGHKPAAISLRPQALATKAVASRSHARALS